MNVYISIGSNIQPERHVPLALAALRRELKTMRASPLYECPPWSRPEQPWFWNGVVEAAADLDRHTLLLHLRRIETALGRVRTSDKDAPRTIDLDIIAAPAFIDPEITRRRFLAIPLLDLAPAFTLPDGRRLADLVRGMRDLPMRRLHQAAASRPLREARPAVPLVRSNGERRARTRVRNRAHTADDPDSGAATEFSP